MSIATSVDHAKSANGAAPEHATPAAGAAPAHAMPTNGVTPRFNRISDADALALYNDLTIHDLGRLAFERVLAMHPEPYRTYVIDRNINYSNVCTAKCIFCNFKADPGDKDAYILSFEKIGEKIEELIDIGGTQILMQGGLVPDETDPHGHGLPFSWYLDLLKFIRKNYPTIHIHAFSPPEIWAFHQVFKMPLADVIARLRDAGLATIPGGGGEILVDRIRNKISHGKTVSHEWLAVMREAHKQGMKTSCTMMMGHIETIEERIEHMRLLRDMQDEFGGFAAFIHWPFQPDGTPLGRMKRLPVEDGSDAAWERGKVGTWEGKTTPSSQADASGEAFRSHVPTFSPSHSSPSHVPTFPPSHDRASPPRRPRNDGKHLLLADAHEYLVWLAVSRLYFDNIPNIQSSWVTMGPKIGQMALFYGANDMGSVMMEENVVSQAGATYRLNEDEIRRLITDAGWTPQQRDQYYRPITVAKRPRPAGQPTPAAPQASFVALSVSGSTL